MKIYKFRPLGSWEDFGRVLQILETGRFWHSKFSDLNDPMEGVFTTDSYKKVAQIFSEKNRYKICSFSGEEALKNPIMWGYYANGFKGVAIEVEVPDTNVVKVKYNTPLPKVGHQIDINKVIKKLLSNKFKYWEHECEYRSLVLDGDNEQTVGSISRLKFCEPYTNFVNKDDISQNSHTLQKHTYFKEKIIRVMESQSINIQLDNYELPK